jgi:hypothetical protein
MNKRFLILIGHLAVCGIMVVSCYGQTVTPAKDTLPCDPMRLDSLVGTVSLSLGSDTVVKKAMPCLLKLWHENKNRGGLDFYLSNAFLSVMEENPSTFFSIMTGDTHTFNDWLQGLPDLSFTWSQPPPCGLEFKRKQLLSILEHSQTMGLPATKLKQSLIRKLSSFRCRQID